jgi:hypothetical protein
MIPHACLGVGEGLQWSWWPYQHWIQDWIVYLSICKNNQYIHIDDVLINLQEHKIIDFQHLPTASNQNPLRLVSQTAFQQALLFSKEPDSHEAGKICPWPMARQIFPDSPPTQAANLHDMQCMWYESAVARWKKNPWWNTRRKNWLWPMGFVSILVK